MKYTAPLIVTKDIDKSVKFYKDIFGLEVTMDFGANKTLEGGICLQTEESYREFIDNKEIKYGGNSFELYFEEDDFDCFISKLECFDIKYVHPVKEHSWGQRVVRIYDLDDHIIEIGENINMVCKRFSDEGMTIEKIAKRMDVSENFVKSCLRN